MTRLSVPDAEDFAMTRIFTLPALIWTLGFIALDLVGVGIVGDAVAHRLGFSPDLLMPVSALICVAVAAGT